MSYMMIMTTKQADWVKYTGSDEQIVDITNCKFGFKLRLMNGPEFAQFGEEV